MRTRTSLLFAALLALPMSALAGRAEAELELTSARANVAAAERAEAATHATQELSQARDLLARAEGSFRARDWRDAELEAQRAKADARLAEALSRQRIAENTLTEMRRTLNTLREEIAYSGGQS